MVKPGKQEKHEDTREQEKGGVFERRKRKLEGYGGDSQYQRTLGERVLRREIQ